MTDPQRKILSQLQYGLSFYLACSALMMSAAMSSAVAEDAAVKSKTLTSAKEVSFIETIKQTNQGGTGEIVPLGDYAVTVVRGDSLSSILRENLGSLRTLWEVARYNDLDTPDSLEPGQEILIPASLLFPNQSDTQSVQLVSSPATLADPENTVQTTQTEEQYVVVDLTQLSLVTDPENTVQSAKAEKQYIDVDLKEISTTPDRSITVNKGDSLSIILRENLGSLRGLREVARYNKLDTPDMLEPGQIILIPGYM